MSSPIPVSVSKSSVGVFNECKRRWLYQQRHWQVPPPFGREAGFLKTLMPANAFVGYLVDDAITGVLRRYVKTGEWLSVIEERVAQLYDVYISSAVDLRKKYDSGVSFKRDLVARRQPPADFFLHGPPTEEVKRSHLESALNLIQTWYSSSIPTELRSMPRECVQPQAEGVPSAFLVGVMEVYAKPDLIVMRDGTAHIFDWKAGRFNEFSERSAEAQLSLYGYFAEHELDVTAANISLEVVWLVNGPEHCRQEMPYSPAKAAKVIEDFKKVYLEATARLQDGQKMGPNGMLEAFPITENLRTCQGCPFVFCEGHKRVE